MTASTLSSQDPLAALAERCLASLIRNTGALGIQAEGARRESFLRHFGRMAEQAGFITMRVNVGVVDPEFVLKDALKKAAFFAGIDARTMEVMDVDDLFDWLNGSSPRRVLLVLDNADALTRVRLLPFAQQLKQRLSMNRRGLRYLLVGGKVGMNDLIGTPQRPFHMFAQLIPA
ncbi:MAG: hypothetical protein PHI49_12880 [Halothiobacillaceae bacterium]|nr:hypothetical protein [Halothiobacillaceae bacterium]